MSPSHADVRDVEEYAKSKLGKDADDNLVYLKALIGGIQRLKTIENKKVHENHNKRWNAHDNTRLLELLRSKVTKDVMEQTLGRTKRAIEYQLSKLLIKLVKNDGFDVVSRRYNISAAEYEGHMDTLHHR